MAITVIPRGTDWRDTFMTGLGGLAIGALDKFLGQLQQNEQNRKINAFRAQANQDINDLVARENNGGISLTPQNLPEGYNSNGWANTLHNSYTPLTQFDVGTSAIPRRGATTQEIRNVIDNLAGTQRFNMINPDAVQGIRNDFVQAAEAQRLQSLQDRYAAQFQNAQSLPEQMKALTLGVGHAGMPYQALTAFSPFAVNSIPQFVDVDLGDQKLTQYRIPLTGENRTVGQYQVGINPEKRLDAMIRKQIAEMQTNADMYGYDRRAEAQMHTADISYKPTVVQDSKGRYYIVPNNGGNATPVTDEKGNHIIGAENIDPNIVKLLENIDSTADPLYKRIKEIDQSLLIEDNPKMIDALLDERKRNMSRITELQKQRDGIVSKYFPTGETIGGTIQPPTIPVPAPTSADVPTALGNLQPVTPDFLPQVQGGDIRPSSMSIKQVAENAPKPQAKQRTPQATQKANTRRAIRETSIPAYMIFTGDTPEDQAKTPEHFTKWFNSLLNDPKMAKFSAEQLMEIARDQGFRIKK